MTLTLTLPDDLYQNLVALAGQQRVSVERVAAAAIAGQVSGWSHLQDLAGRADRNAYLAALDQVPNTKPAPEDAL